MVQPCFGPVFLQKNFIEMLYESMESKKRVYKYIEHKMLKFGRFSVVFNASLKQDPWSYGLDLQSEI